MEDCTEKPRALALVGMPGAGKTVCAQHLRRKGYFTLRFGAVVIDEVRRRGWTLSPARERSAREELRAAHGMAAMALISLPKLHEALRRHQCIVIDGLYSFSEYKLLSEKLGAPLVLVAVAAPRQLRYQRLAARPERPLSARQARERDMQEIESLEKGGPIAMADYTLLNDRAPTDLLDQLDALLESLAFAP
ncbi:MAG: AAA family ATPase [Chloroflexota bacterium]|nr:AAA family ATPase [Chloroflexota bacterium]